MQARTGWPSGAGSARAPEKGVTPTANEARDRLVEWWPHLGWRNIRQGAGAGGHRFPPSSTSSRGA